MRRIAVLTSLVALCLAPGIAWAKLPYFDLEVSPLDPEVGEPIIMSFTWFRDEGHTQPSSCGQGRERSRIAWVHPLDHEGQLDRADWLLVEGGCTPTGAIQGRIVLDEPGAYDVLPLWRTWQDRPEGGGFPGVIRIEVREPPRIAPMAGAALGTVGIAVALIAWRRRAARPHVTR